MTTFAKGQSFPCEATASTDDKTGTRIVQLTNHPGINHNLYFLTSSFLPDQQSVVFSSDRSGRMNFYRAGYPDGDIVQLTDADDIHGYSGVISHDGTRLFFTRSSAIVALDLDNLAEDTLADFPGGGLGEVSLSHDGAFICSAIKIDGQNGIVVASTDGTGGSIIHRQNRTIIHPQFHPTNADLIEYAADPAPRMFLIHRDGSGNRCLHDHDNDEFVVHETWLGQTGDLCFTVWPKALKRMNVETGEIIVITDFNAWHIAPNRAGTKVLCDTNHPDLGLQLIDVADGSRKTICHPRSSNGGSQWKTSRYALKADFEAATRAGASADHEKALSWMEMKVDTVYGPQWTHPHPSFSPDERFVTYTSDHPGHPQLHVAEIPK
jgi:hypothetical protein